MSSESTQRRQALAAALAPGFRFHPTDEELVGYYLKRKIAGKAFRVDAISDIDIYKSEPWDLPGKSRIQSRDLEWYFFSALDKKYANRSRTNRATGSGYWKTTGKDRPVLCGGRLVGMKKTLVFHIGRAPKGERTNWVMHEYRLEDAELANSRIPQDAFVVCRVFQKKGPGPQNGAQYGAPLVEEEWEKEDEEGVEEQGDGEICSNVITDDSLLAEDWSIEDLIVPLNTDFTDGIDNDIKDEFLELNDILSSPTKHVKYQDEALKTLPGLNSNEKEEPRRLEFITDQYPDTNSFLEVSDILGPERIGENVPSPLEVNSSDNPAFFHAPNTRVHNSFPTSSSEPDLLDELLAYFDATENIDSESKDVDSKAQQVNQWQEPLKSLESTQPLIAPLDDNFDGIKSKGGLSGRLVSMLGSISSPPAFAAEKRPDPILIAPAMAQRNIDFFLTYPEDVNLGKVPKIEGGLMAFVQRNSFHLVFLSVLLVAASFKICICVCSR